MCEPRAVVWTKVSGRKPTWLTGAWCAQVVDALCAQGSLESEDALTTNSRGYLSTYTAPVPQSLGGRIPSHAGSRPARLAALYAEAAAASPGAPCSDHRPPTVSLRAKVHARKTTVIVPPQRRDLGGLGRWARERCRQCHPGDACMNLSPAQPTGGRFPKFKRFAESRPLDGRDSVSALASVLFCLSDWPELPSGAICGMAHASCTACVL